MGTPKIPLVLSCFDPAVSSAPVLQHPPPYPVSLFFLLSTLRSAAAVRISSLSPNTTFPVNTTAPSVLRGMSFVCFAYVLLLGDLQPDQ